MLAAPPPGYAGSSRSVVGSVSVRSMLASGPAQRAYLRRSASLTRSTSAGSSTGTARTRGARLDGTPGPAPRREPGC
jgi:hypothetical protein